MQRKGSQCGGGGGGGVNMKCSVLQWHWKTLMYVLDDDKFKCGFGALIGIGLIFCFPSPHTHHVSSLHYTHQFDLSHKTGETPV